MRTSLHRALVASFAALLTFPVGIPGEHFTRNLHVAPEAFCHAGDALPARVAALPHFSQAIDSQRQVRIVAIGSSSTQGVGASSPARSYPSQLHALLQLALPGEKFEVINLGIGGETAKTTVERLRRAIPRLSPDLVVWQVGTNDALDGVPVADYEATVRGALEFLKASGRDTLLIGMQWTRKLAANRNYAGVREATDRVARQEGVSLVSRYEAMRKLADASGREEFTGPDHLHMNDRGYRCLAEEVAATLSRAVDGEASTPSGRI